MEARDVIFFFENGAFPYNAVLTILERTAFFMFEFKIEATD